jgi:transcriptional regulator with XRE-family HTH domain
MNNIMSLTGPISFLLPEDAARELGQRARERRLASNLSRKTLAAQSGVPAATIRLFETTGKLGVVAMLQLADALGCMDSVAGLFPPKATKTLDEFVAPKRRRGMK